MIKLFRYELNSDFENEKTELNKLDDFVSYSDDTDEAHFKKQNIFFVTTNNSGATINKISKNGDTQTITLKNDKNKLADWNYGFNFARISNIKQIINFDLSNYDTSNVTNMASMFNECSGLVSLDLSNFDTVKVTNMSKMFHNCSKLTSLDLSSFDTSNVIDMSYMFNVCTSLTSINLKSFNTINVKSMIMTFRTCPNLLSLDLSSFNTSNVSNMNYLFAECINLTSLDLSNFDISKVTDMSSMFVDCNSLTHIKCKQAFKDWCLSNQDTINLPTAMRDNGNGQWEII